MTASRPHLKTNRKTTLSESITCSDTTTSIAEFLPIWWDGDETAGSLSGNYYTFTGRRSDPEAELMYFRNRYYSPELGRFVGRDPQESSPTGLYSYCGNNPTSWVDPMGNEREKPGVLVQRDPWSSEGGFSPIPGDVCHDLGTRFLCLFVD